MIRTKRQLQIDRAILAVLNDLPDGYLLTDGLLRGEVEQLVPGLRPTTAETDEAIRYADGCRRITGIVTEEGQKWRLAEAGRALIAERSRQ